jgi:hypothetical protein
MTYCKIVVPWNFVTTPEAAIQLKHKKLQNRQFKAHIGWCTYTTGAGIRSWDFALGDDCHDCLGVRRRKSVAQWGWGGPVPFRGAGGWGFEVGGW